MANISPDTFDPSKNYVAVRLQRGVPLVDADWNELNDVIRQEVYEGLSTIFSDGVPPGKDLSFQLFLEGSGLYPIDHPGPNDFYVNLGPALVGGRPLNRPTYRYGRRNFIRYTNQPWCNAQRAAQDGVDVISALTTPNNDRTDLVYLDVWEREVDSTEDNDLINPAIGLETCVRFKREIAIRVAEGATKLPNHPEHHRFMPLALLKRQAKQARIENDQIHDIRPRIGPRGIHSVALSPSFQPAVQVNLQNHIVSELTNWKYVQSGTMDTGGSTICLLNTNLAHKPKAQNAFGILPLVFPHGARLNSATVHGYTARYNPELPDTVVIMIKIWRTPYVAKIQQGPGQGRLASFSNASYLLLEGNIIHTAQGVAWREFNLRFTPKTENGMNLIDNNRYSYTLSAESSGRKVSDFEAWISSLVLNYQY